MAEPAPRLHVCVTCRAGQDAAEGEATAGQRLHDALADLLGADADAPVVLRAVSCLASCERGCAAAISSPGKWGYLLGGLSAGQAQDLLAYAAAYAAARTGTVMPSRRPASLGQAVLARFPAFEAAS